MARTIKRQPFTVSTDSGDYPKSYYFNQTQFKGLCDQKNDVSIDQLSLADVNNVYVDENDILTSRPPFKFYDGECFIVDQWLFGAYGLRLHRILCRIEEDEDGNKIAERVDNPQDYPTEELYFIFLLRCITHNTVAGEVNDTMVYGEYTWTFPVSTLGWDFIPKVTCTQVEDKIFVWFAGIDFVAFNTAGVLMSDGNTYPYFENAIKYLYFPICKLVINGIESDLETKNFLTETYKRRYQYSAISQVNFEKLIGRQMSVNLNGDMTQSKSKHLYDIIVQENQDKMMVYPYSPVGNNYHIDIAQTSRATVVLRYGFASHVIEVSFDGKYFRPAPVLEDIIGNPQLTRDGLWIVAFTRKGLAKCRLVAQESEDFIEPENVLSWAVEPYMRNVLINGFPGYLDTLDTSFTPSGYFETIDQFAYVFSGPSIYDDITGNVQYLYSEWLSGSNNLIWGYTLLVDFNDNGMYMPRLPSDDIKIHFRYVAPTIDHKDLGAVVSIITPGILSFNDTDEIEMSSTDACVFFFKQVEDNINRTLRNDDLLYVTEFLGNKRDENANSLSGYVYRLTNNGTQFIDYDNKINSGDILLNIPYPLYISDTAEYDATRMYNTDEYCVYGGYLFKARRSTIGNAPVLVDYSDDWSPLRDPRSTADTWFGMPPKVRKDAVVNDVAVYFFVDWRFLFLCDFINVRYRIETTDGTIGAITPNKRIKMSSFDLDSVFSAKQLNELFGPLTIYNSADNSINTTDGWNTIYPGGIIVPKNPSPVIYTGNTVIIGLSNPTIVERMLDINLGVEMTDTENNSSYILQGFGVPCRQMDINTMAPVIEAERIVYDFVIGYSLLYRNQIGEYKYFDFYCKYEYEYIANKLLEQNDEAIHFVLGNSQWFRIMPNTDTVLTDLYLFINNEVITLPNNGELYSRIEDEERNVANNDNLVLTLRKDAESELMVYDRNIHKLTSDGVNLASGLIQSGSVVSYVENAITEKDYLQPGYMSSNNGAPIGLASNRFYIERLGIDASGNFVVVSGEIKSNELIRLRAYDKNITLPVGNVGNPYDKDMLIYSWEYPAAPDDWTLGDDWPANFPTYPPIYPNADGTIRFWAPGDPLPTGPIMLYGTTNLLKRVQPISIDSTGVWYNIDGTLWTSQISTDTALELDEYINSEVRNIVDEQGTVVSKTRIVDMRTDVPDFHAVMNEHYFSFTAKDTGHHLLEVTSTRRDENKLFSDEGTDILLYLPKRNEQKFSNEITNLHPLSDTEIGIFTENEVWYVSTVTSDSGTVAYSKPIKSKIPIGCRKGNQVITALDGQALIFPTARGITALAPQDFIATTEKTLTYLSDAIQEKYHKFYNDGVKNAALIPEEFELAYRPMIRINTYKYWILFHRYMDREILALDTRYGTWWIWTTPYPIRSIMVGSRLHVLMQMDFTPMGEIGMSFPTNPAPLMGVSFVFADKEIQIVTDDREEFPTIGDTPIANIGYYDDTVDRVLNGISELVYENKFVGWRRVLQYASPKIPWHITSQRLHFDQINNYKAIKGINFNLKGTDTMTAKLSTKAFHNLYHPEQSDVVEIKINDLRTFVKRFNIMHAIDFQYKIENDAEADTQRQLKLNSLSIKYEVKERVR